MFFVHLPSEHLQTGFPIKNCWVKTGSTFFKRNNDNFKKLTVVTQNTELKIVCRKF